MIRNNSPRKNDAISELNQIIQEYSLKKNKHSTMMKLKNWNFKYRSPETYQITKRLWKKIL